MDLIFFPIIYIASFLYFFKGLFQHKPDRILWFIILGISSYTTSLSITYAIGFTPAVNAIKYFKEIAAVSTLAYLVMNHRGKFNIQVIDWLVMLLFTYCLAYVFIPVGKMTFIERITVFKSYGMFGLFYFIGRLLPLSTDDFKKYWYIIIAVMVFAVVLQQAEVVFDKHFQNNISYTDYNQQVNQIYPSGSYGLTMTFETDNGIKRFASFFHDPLDFAISLLMCLCLVLAWISFDNDKIIPDKWKWLIVMLLLWGLYKTFSRASMLGSILVLYAYAIMTKRKLLLRTLYFSILLGIFWLILFAEDKFQGYVIDTVLFRESSSLGHLISWVTGIDAMLEQPFGMGLGSSGLYAFGDGLGIGGESQPIFMGVQTGIISMLLYLIIYIYLFIVVVRKWSVAQGEYKMLGCSILLMKIGFFIPMLTSYFESFLYLSYLSWIFYGLFINYTTSEQ
jgi:hypothetical protein